MTISKGKELLNKEKPTANEIRKTIAALDWERGYVQKTMKAGLRDAFSGQETVDEITELITDIKIKFNSEK